jgi:hypothetical protein
MQQTQRKGTAVYRVQSNDQGKFIITPDNGIGQSKGDWFSFEAAQTWADYYNTTAGAE